MTMTLIASQKFTTEVGNFVFSNIPQQFTDLQIVVSARTNSTYPFSTIAAYFNNGGYPDALVTASRTLFGTGTNVYSDTNGQGGYTFLGQSPANQSSANIFGTTTIYIADYASNKNKIITTESASENVSAVGSLMHNTVLRTDSAPITTINVESFLSFPGSMVSLYGISKGSGGACVGPISWEFQGTQTDGFTTSGASFTASNGIATLTATSADPVLYSPTVSYNGTFGRYIKITWKRTTPAQAAAWDGFILYTTSGHGFSGSYAKFFPQPVWTSDYQTTVIDMGVLNSGGNDYLQNIITSLRFDFLNELSSNAILIDSITLSNTP